MDATSVVGSVLAAFGLSGSTGLNAWLPLFATALLDRLGVVDLAEPVDSMSSTTGLVVLALLMLVDLVGDKIPAVDHVLHLAGTLVAPASGAAVFVAQTQPHADVPTAGGIVLGAVTAGAIHLGRSALRAGSTATTAGAGSPLLSLGEDATAGFLVAAAFLIPILACALVAALLVGGVVLVLRLRGRLRPST